MVSNEALLFLMVLGISLTVSVAKDCSGNFKENTKNVEASEFCLKEKNIKLEEMPKSEDDFTKSFDDKCFGQCFMEKLGLAKNFTLDRDAITADIKEHVIDETTQKKVLEYTLKCIDEAEKEKTQGDCKTVAQFLFCSMKAEQTLEC